MKNDQKKLLHLLIDKYEGSKLSTGENLRRVSIRIPFNKQTVPDYFNEVNFQRVEAINESCHRLEELKFVTINWRSKDQYIEAIELNIDKVDEIYSFLRRPKKSEQEEQLKLLLAPYSDRTDFIGRFARDMIDRLNNHKSVKRYFDLNNIKESQDVMTALCELVKQDKEILKRKFSVLVFKDSKRFEKIEGKITSIIREFSEEEFSNEDDILSEFNVITNPSYIYMKGIGTFLSSRETIDLEKLGTELVLNATAIENLKVVHLPAKRVLTIENLTTFYEYEPNKELVIYLGGYHNRMRRRLLQTIYHFNPNLSFYHWGDIDLGGFQILNHLRQKTGIPFHPYKMDLDTLKHYQQDAQRINQQSYLKKLKNLLDKDEFKEFQDILEYMIKHQIRLEQERIIM